MSEEKKTAEFAYRLVLHKDGSYYQQFMVQEPSSLAFYVAVRMGPEREFIRLKPTQLDRYAYKAWTWSFQKVDSEKFVQTLKACKETVFGPVCDLSELSASVPVTLYTRLYELLCKRDQAKGGDELMCELAIAEFYPTEQNWYHVASTMENSTIVPAKFGYSMEYVLHQIIDTSEKDDRLDLERLVDVDELDTPLFFQFFVKLLQKRKWKYASKSVDEYLHKQLMLRKLRKIADEPLAAAAKDP